MLKILKNIAAAAALFGTSSVLATEVQKLDHGSWNDPVVVAANGDRAINVNVWIDAKVENLGFHKDVAIVWTSNDWETVNESTAFFERTLEDGTEQWGADIHSIGRLSDRHFGTFWAHLFDMDEPGFEWLDGGLCTLTSCSVNIRYAIRYIDLDSGEEYWDNNNSENYTIVIGASLEEE